MIKRISTNVDNHISRIIQNMDSNILNICQQLYDKKNLSFFRKEQR